jgi:hypothetical protein
MGGGIEMDQHSHQRTALTPAPVATAARFLLHDPGFLQQLADICILHRNPMLFGQPFIEMPD